MKAIKNKKSEGKKANCIVEKKSRMDEGNERNTMIFKLGRGRTCLNPLSLETILTWRPDFKSSVRLDHLPTIADRRKWRHHCGGQMWHLDMKMMGEGVTWSTVYHMSCHTYKTIIHDTEWSTNSLWYLESKCKQGEALLVTCVTSANSLTLKEAVLRVCESKPRAASGESLFESPERLLPKKKSKTGHLALIRYSLHAGYFYWH